MKYVLRYSLQLLLEIYFTYINKWVTFEMGAEMHVDLHVKCPLLLSDLNQYLDVPTNFNKALQYYIS
jgi:hypothetical protein